MTRLFVSLVFGPIGVSAFSTEVDVQIEKPKPKPVRTRIQWNCKDMPSHDHPCDEPPAVAKQSFDKAAPSVVINGQLMYQAPDHHHIKPEQFLKKPQEKPKSSKSFFGFNENAHTNVTIADNEAEPIDERGCPTCPAVFMQNKGDIHQDCRCWDLTSAAAVRKFRYEAQLWNMGHSGASYCSCPVDNYEAREGWGTNCANREPVPGKLVRGAMRTYLASKTTACGCCCRMISKPFIKLEERCYPPEPEPDQQEGDEILEDGEDLDETPSVAKGGRRMRRGLSLMQLRTDENVDNVGTGKKKHHKINTIARTSVRFIFEQ